MASDRLDPYLGEIVYYSDGSLWVTSKRVVFGQATYPLSEVASVEVRAVDPRRQSPFTYAFVLVVLSLYLGLSLWVWSHDPFVFGVYACMAILLPVLVVFVLVRLRTTNLHARHFLRLNGKQDMFVSLDGGYAQWLADLIMNAKSGTAAVVSTPAHLASSQGAATAFTYYADDFVSISEERITLGSEKYKVADIKKVGMGQIQTSSFSWRLILGPCFMSCNSLLVGLRSHQPDYGRGFHFFLPGDVELLWWLWIVGGLIFLIWSLMKPQSQISILWLQGKFGRVEAFVTFDNKHARTLKEYMDLAIDGRHAQIKAASLTAPE